jgi:hypothetical protein
MSGVTPVEGDKYINDLDMAEARLRAFTFPMLTIVRVVDDAGTEDEYDHEVVWCPRCDQRVESEEITEVDICIRENETELSEDVDGDPFLGIYQVDANFDTLYYLHNGHGVSLPSTQTIGRDWYN